MVSSALSMLTALMQYWHVVENKILLIKRTAV